MRNCQSSSITLADDFTTSLSPTSYSPRAYCPCQTGLKAPITTGCPLTHSLSQHKLPAYLVPTALHNISRRRVHPNSTALPHLSSYNCTTSACAAFSTQCLLLKSRALPTQLHTPQHYPPFHTSSTVLRSTSGISDFIKSLKTPSTLVPSISSFTTSPQRVPQPHLAQHQIHTFSPPRFSIKTAPCQHSLPTRNISLISPCTVPPCV